MPYTITDSCTACDRCVDVCPIGAIQPGDPIYVIDDTCCDFEECLVECQDEAIVPFVTEAGPVAAGAGPVAAEEKAVGSHGS